MDLFNKLLYDAAEQKTQALPLQDLLETIKREGAVEAPAHKTIRRPMRRSFVLAAAIVLMLMLFAVPALADMRIVVVDGVTRLAVDGRVRVDGVVYELDAPLEEAGIRWEPENNQYVIEPPATPTPEATNIPTPTPSPTPELYTVTAVTPVEVYTTAAILVYDGPGENFPVLGRLATGSRTEKTGISGDGWAMIGFEGKTGFVRDVELSYAPKTPVEYPAVKKRAVMDAVVRDAPDENAAVIGSLAIGDRVESNGSLGEWTRIKWQGQAGYVEENALAVYEEGKDRRTDGYFVIDGVQYSLGYPDGGEGWDAVQTETVKFYASTNAVLYEGPGEEYAQITVLYPGEQVKKVGASGGHWIFLYDGRLCYGEKASFKVAPLTGADYPAKEKIVIVEAEVWAKPRMDHPEEFLGTIAPGTKVSATGSIDVWMQLTVDGKKVYVLEETLINPWEITPTPDGEMAGE